MSLIQIWGLLVAATLVEVALAFQKLGVALFLAVLLGISIGKSALIIGYFMHLKFERRSLAVALMLPTTVFIVALFGLLPDAR